MRILNNIRLKGFLQAFERESRIVMEKLDQLHEALHNLQFEGKMFLGKNIYTIEKITQYLKDRYVQHIELDEKVIFPFVKIHVPRLEPVLNFLRAERNEFNTTLETFEALYQELKSKNGELGYYKIIGKLTDKGIYLVCLIRSHIQMEKESVYKVIEQELHLSEKRKLVKEIKTTEWIFRSKT